VVFRICAGGKFTGILLQFCQRLFQPFEFFPGAFQYFTLYLEFLAGNEVELAQGRLQQAAKIAFHIGTQCPQVVWYGVSQLARELIDDVSVHNVYLYPLLLLTVPLARVPVLIMPHSEAVYSWQCPFRVHFR